MGIMNTITQEKYGYSYPKKRYESKPTAISYACADGEWMMISVLEYAGISAPCAPCLACPSWPTTRAMRTKKP